MDEGREQLKGTHVSPEYITGVSGDVSGKAEVADLRHSAMSQQNVSRCKIPVDTLHTKTNKKLLLTL